MNTRLKLFTRSIKLVFSAARFHTWSGILLSLIASVLPLGLVWLIKTLIDTVTEAAETGSYEISRIVILIVVGIALLYFLEEAIRALSSLVRKKQSYRVES